MFCSKCGSEVDESVKFCPKCGALLQSAIETAQEAVPETVQEETKEAAESADDAKAGQAKETVTEAAAGAADKGKKKVIIWAAAAAAAVLLLLIIPNLGNFYYSKLASPQKYFAHVAKRELDECASNFAAIYKNTVKNLNPFDSGAEFDVSFELGRKAADLLEIVGDLAGVDVSEIKKLQISGDYNINKDKVRAEVETYLNKDSIISADVIFDDAAGNAYLLIPELSSQYIGAEEIASPYTLPGSLIYAGFGGYGSLDEDDAKELYQTIDDALGALPRDGKIESIIKKYGHLIAENIGEVKKKTGKTLKVKGITQNCTLLEVTLDEDTLEDIKEKILSEIERDKDIKEIIAGFSKINAFGEIDEDEMIEEIYNSVEYVIDDLIYEVNRTQDEELVLKLYVDNGCNIIGVETEIEYGYYTDSFKFESVKKGSKVAYNLDIDEEYTLSGSGKKSGDKITAEFSLEDGEGNEYAVVSTKNWDIKKMKKGEISGVFTIKPGKALTAMPTSGLLYELPREIRSALGGLGNLNLKNTALELDIESGFDKAEFDATLFYKDEVFFSAGFYFKNIGSSKISIPQKAVIVEDLDDLEDWAETVNWDKFLKKLAKTAIPDEVIDILEDVFDYLEDGDYDRLQRFLYNLF